MLSYPTPPLCQGADQSFIVSIGNIIFPGDFEMFDGGVRVWVDAPMPDAFAREQSRARFDFTLGVLRAWRSAAGELEIEQDSRFAPGAVHDEAGNQWV